MSLPDFHLPLWPSGPNKSAPPSPAEQAQHQANVQARLITRAQSELDPGSSLIQRPRVRPLPSSETTLGQTAL